MTPADLRAARAASGLSQTDWGFMLGITRQHVSKLERGVVPPSQTIINFLMLLPYVDFDNLNGDMSRWLAAERAKRE